LKALRLYGPRDLRLEEVPEPDVGPGDVLVEVEVALAGAAEARAFREGHAHVLPGPTLLGREFCGIDVATGRRVVAASSAPCGRCASCQAGREALCRRPAALEDAFAELLLVPARIAEINLHVVPAASAPRLPRLSTRLPAACMRSSAQSSGPGASWLCSAQARSG
jgi:L-iditol 2-dehydrogenase